MVKNIVFDVGGVLLDYRWLDMFIEHGHSAEEANRLGCVIFHNPLWQILDYGIIPLPQVLDAYALAYPEDEGEIRWFVNHGEDMRVRRPAVEEMVGKLKEAGYGLYILSNYPRWLFDQHIRGTGLVEMMDGVVVSSDIHKVKPDRRIYKHLLETYSLEPGECIFYDDRPENTSAARAVGMQAITVGAEGHLLALLNDKLEEAKKA